MSQQGTIKRYSLIIKKVEEDFYPARRSRIPRLLR